jgi:hypothetical protein
MRYRMAYTTLLSLCGDGNSGAENKVSSATGRLPERQSVAHIQVAHMQKERTGRKAANS